MSGEPATATADPPQFTERQILESALRQLGRMEAGSREQDEHEATAWVVELIDPDLPEAAYTRRQLGRELTELGGRQFEGAGDDRQFAAADDAPMTDVRCSIDPTTAPTMTSRAWRFFDLQPVTVPIRNVSAGAALDH